MTEETHPEGKRGRIGFSTTPLFREKSEKQIETFVYEHLYSLCLEFDVLVTGGTHDWLEKNILRKRFARLEDANRERIVKDKKITDLDAAGFKHWKDTIKSGMKPTMGGIRGMIHVTYELVEGRLDAVIHFARWEDKAAKPDTEVLSREANVHKVPIATDLGTAQAFAQSWKGSIAQAPNTRVFKKERDQPKEPPLKGISPGDRVLAMVAHDKRKLAICRFAVEHAGRIFDDYQYILATGTTGKWIKRFMKASGSGAGDIKKIRCCNSGPKGGDVQIAYAVVKGYCKQIIFLQDPSMSHPHDSDIRLFEQAVAGMGGKVKLATNVESAQLLITSEVSNDDENDEEE